MKITISLFIMLVSAMILASCTTPDVVKDAGNTITETASNVVDETKDAMENTDTETSENVVV